MRPLSGDRLLRAWEQGMHADDLRRPLVILGVAMPSQECEQLSAMPVAGRNQLLLRLHELTFGPVLNIFGECPECGARLEFDLPVGALAAQLDDQPVGAVTWQSQGQRYSLRPVTTDDLVACLDVPELTAAQDLLLSRCLEGSSAPADSAEVLRRFEQLNAAAELNCAVRCPGCARDQVLDLDLGRFVWAEVRTAARRLLAEIHDLASVYGWSEKSIARMSAARRGAYLELLSA
jgi:hypothetical protein